MIQTLEYWDKQLLLKINACHTPFWDVVMWVLSNDFFIYPFVIVGLIFVFNKTSGKNVAAVLLGIGLCVACADLSANFVKHSVKRYRPTHNTEIQNQVHTVNDYKGGKYGFFSSHASNTFAIVTLFFLTCKTLLSKKVRFAFYMLPLLIIYSRVYLGVHYPSDVFVGAIIGILFGTIIHKVLMMYFFEKKASIN